MRVTKLLADIDFRMGGNSDACVMEGWAEPEITHRWTMGRESRLVLPRFGADCVLVINATPCIHPPGLPGQAIMLAINDRLLASAEFPGLRVYAFRLPNNFQSAEAPVLSIAHLNCEMPRAPEQYRNDQPLGLMVHGIRIYALAPGEPAGPAPTRSPDSLEALALCFESLGQGCQFGLIQRQMGAEPLNLLRFVDTTTSRLVDGLVTGFAGVDSPDGLTLGQADRSNPTYTWRQDSFQLTFDTLIDIGKAEPHAVLRDQVKRLAFLRRKFAEDLRAAEKIYVLTRSDVLTEPEALAVFCALSLHGKNTLLWTVFGDPASTGQVEEMAPGFLRGQLGVVDEERYAPLAAWLQLLKNAYDLKK